MELPCSGYRTAYPPAQSRMAEHQKDEALRSKRPATLYRPKGAIARCRRRAGSDVATAGCRPHVARYFRSDTKRPGSTVDASADPSFQNTHLWPGGIGFGVTVGGTQPH